MRLRSVATRAGIRRQWLVLVVAAAPDGGVAAPLAHTPQRGQAATKPADEMNHRNAKNAENPRYMSSLCSTGFVKFARDPSRRDDRK